MLTTLLANFGNLQIDYNFNRTGKLFKTDNITYFYDSGTGKVFECEGNELILMELLLDNKWQEFCNIILNNNEFEEAFYNLYSLVQEEYILQLPYYQSFTNENDNENFCREGYLKQITLEVTQKCNLRCKYCIYNEDYEVFRDFGKSDMTWETAKNALDYANEHAGDDIFVGFYGGEPLLNFDLIKQCVEYCLDTFKSHSQLYFTMTSNLTVLTKEMADYFASIPNFQIVCSLDGPSDIQNRFRVFSNNIGSFDMTVKGLRLMVDALKDQAESRLSIHSVLCPPFNKQKLDSLRDFFQNLSWLPKGVAKNIAYVGEGSLNEKYYDLKEIKTGIDTSLVKEDPLKAWAINELINKDKDYTYAFQIQQTSLMRMHQRSILDEPAKRLFRNACCTPGIRKLYIGADGNISLCERIGNSPNIGNIYTGIDFDKLIEKYIHEYDDYSLNKCNQCWAMHLCNNCYALCYDQEGLNKDEKEKQCNICRKIIENDLSCYYHLMKEAPEIMELLDSIEQEYS